MQRAVNRFVKTLQEKALTIAFAESVTCGMATQKLSIYKGTSDVLAGALVCYSPEVKKACLGISQNMIDHYTSESMEVTVELAKNLSRLIKADIHAAITGLASPGGSETKAKPVGTVFLCFTYKGKIYKRRIRFYGSPSDIREKACLELYEFILEKI